MRECVEFVLKSTLFIKEDKKFMICKLNDRVFEMIKYPVNPNDTYSQIAL